MNKNQPFRPQFHFTPQQNWMNDPNGMVYYDGEYHLFYQYNPEGTTWGPMHWGHAISDDLVHWTHEPVALKPDGHGAIFSGSAVVDWHDSSGFFDGKSGLVAIFTHHDEQPDGRGRRERQSLAYSRDSGRSWIKYKGNPVLSDKRFSDFRDPKVFWYEPQRHWVMILAAGQCVMIYHSRDLKSWTYASTFGEGQGSHLGVWECPDLFELPVDGDAEHKRWVMLVSIGNDTEHVEGSRTQYFIGSFDGNTFRNGNDPDIVKWLDHGRDNYAGFSWSDIPSGDGRRIFIGWMSNWRYAQVTPTEGWRSAMTVPRVLTVSSRNHREVLLQQPVQELHALRMAPYEWTDVIVSDGNNLLDKLRLECFEIVACFELGTAEEFGFKVRTSGEHETVIGYLPQTQELYVDRTRSGESSFHADFSGRHSGILAARNNRIQLRILVDASSVEVFGNEGETVITDLIFPGKQEKGASVYARNGRVALISLQIFPLRSTL